MTGTPAFGTASSSTGPTESRRRGDWYSNPSARDFPSVSAPGHVLDFHLRLPGYAPTPLRDCPELAAELGVGRVFVKEEAERFGLPAFKMVGASWAVCRALAATTSEPDRLWTFDELRKQLDGGVRLVCATDGNHGRAVAHTAALLGLKARVFVPASIGQRAKDGIVSEGAQLTEVDEPYDNVVRKAARAAAADPQALLVQDTAWAGYEQIPGWIVQGYSTIFREIDAQLRDARASGADVVVTPCGVGSLIQATVAHYRGEGRGAGVASPSLLSVEPEESACLLESLRAGRPVSVRTGPTRMAGLNCGTVSSIAWPVLQGGVDAAVTITEDQDLQAVRELARLGLDSGPCGAASLAGIKVVAENAALRQAMGISAASVVVLLSTESLAANPVS
ncbi:diaminopropionate ammonia-lyase [Arthrobacter sp. H14-L1]|uniref:diaminopropionate ammonia-lyase n=1 Tax=Arthrobacter sp. H14-L1 TaxID=2996697 RepID=UPI002271B40D|nr:diaminopropionate ammonia-lyase [Arthrobacter sp. H14-L1]MCY0905556.1 diaminopropionate ammonia-lyase [Arthrobacter sp. H14-L1]